MKSINRLILSIFISVAFNFPAIGTLQAEMNDFLLSDNGKYPSPPELTDRFNAQYELFTIQDKELTERISTPELSDEEKINLHEQQKLIWDNRRGLEKKYKDISYSWQTVWEKRNSSPIIKSYEMICHDKSTELKVLIKQIKKLEALIARDKNILKLDLDQLSVGDDRGTTLNDYAQSVFTNILQTMVAYKKLSFTEIIQTEFVDFFKEHYNAPTPGSVTTIGEPDFLDTGLSVDISFSLSNPSDYKAFCGSDENYLEAYDRGNMKLDIVFDNIKETLLSISQN